MKKQVAIGPRPTNKPASPLADQWVEKRAMVETSERMKRLTIDIPESLHRAIKGQCGMRGTKIADEVRDLLLQKYGKS
jgi:hypothetical protein